MSAVEAAPRAAPARAEGVRRLGVPVALWLAAALISGFTMWRHLEPFDEGLLLQAATRIAAGEWPYRDFGWAYGPGQPLLVAAAFEAFGPSVIWWRVIRVAADATIALLVWALARQHAPPRWALAGWLAAAVTIAQPASANPTIPALALALGAVYAASRARPVAAGLLAAAAVFWRLDFGLIAGFAMAVGWARAARRPAAARPRRVTAAWARPLAMATFVVATVALYAPFAAATGVAGLADALLGDATTEGGWWSLPFPLVYDGPFDAWPPRALAEHVKDVLGYELPLIGVVGLAAVAAAFLLRRRRAAPAAAGLLVLAVGSLAYLVSRPDDLHAQPLLVCLCALVPIAVATARPPRAPAAVAAAALALVLAAGAANRLSALLIPPDLEPVRLAGVPGIRVPPEEAEALPALVAHVERAVPPGEPIYVAPRRSDLVTLTDPLVHFLVRRPNVLRRDVLLQARPEEQAAIVAALRARRPRVVVRWLDPASSRPEPNRRGRPSGSRALDEYIAGAYEPRGEYGRYAVLERR